MKQNNRLWRVFSRWIGALLLVVSALFAYGWFYKLGPARRVLDPQWLSRHSQEEYWREVQKGIHRGMWLHDDGRNVGMYGDKAWAQWIMNHVKPGTSMGCLGGEPCHSATAMRYLTNQDVGEDAEAWLEWWQQNMSQSQEEWIAQGFLDRGFKIDVPPAPEQTPILLALLGNLETGENTDASDYLKFNAFRCLRDAGFEPTAYALSSRAIPADIERGLLEFTKWQRPATEASVGGKLAFAKQADGPDAGALPALVTPTVQIMAYTLIFVPLVLGSVLVLWSFRTKGNKLRQSSTPTDIHT